MAENTLVALGARARGMELARPIMMERAFVALLALTFEEVRTKFCFIRHDCSFRGRRPIAAVAFSSIWFPRV